MFIPSHQFVREIVEGFFHFGPLSMFCNSMILLYFCMLGYVFFLCMLSYMNCSRDYLYIKLKIGIMKLKYRLQLRTKIKKPKKPICFLLHYLRGVSFLYLSPLSFSKFSFQSYNFIFLICQTLAVEKDERYTRKRLEGKLIVAPIPYTKNTNFSVKKCIREITLM